MEFSNRLKKAREKMNLSQEDVAKELNISRQSISKWELGKCYPDIDNLIKLSNLYNITLDELIKGNYVRDKLIENNKKKISKSLIIFWSIIMPSLYGVYYIFKFH